MATLIPASPQFQTHGEERLAQRLKEKLDSECWLWYDIPVGHKQLHPDFIVLHPSRGIVVLEVKDWKPETVLHADKIQCTIELDGGLTKVVDNPLEQARKNAIALVDELKQDATLQQPDGSYQGNLIFPWAHGVVLTNITRKQFEALDWQRVMEPHHVICQDEMQPSVPADELGNRLWDMLPYRQEGRLSMAERDRVRGILFPDIRTFSKIGLSVMNVQQEQLARGLGEGHRVLHGVAGSGKTLILCSRAHYLAQKSTETSQPILVLCFNKPLATKIDNLMQERGVGKKVLVRNFHKWCRDQLIEFKLQLPPENQPVDAKMAEIVQRVIDGVRNGTIPSGRYQAVLIDEGHDFHDDWLRLAVQMVNPETNNLLLVYDGSQAIFERKNTRFTFKSVGIQAQGRSRPVLKINYRNTRQILQTASAIASDWLQTDDQDEDGVPIMQPVSIGAEGEAPIFIRQPSLEKEAFAIANQLVQAHKDGFAWSDMAILYTGWNTLPIVRNVLTQRQIPFHVYESKVLYQPSVDAISMMTMKVSKGLEFPVVVIPGVGYMPTKGENEKEAAQIFYVAATRAMQRLILGVDGGGNGGFGGRF